MLREMEKETTKIAILASGNGTNAQQISEYFASHPTIEVRCILYNRRDAYVAERAKRLGIEARYFKSSEFLHSDHVLEYLKMCAVDYVVLAGFLLLVPKNLLETYRNRIINIHPALLPRFGGKGMYGHHVHEAVVASGETESGITIHLVDEMYDHGKILFQAKCRLTADDTPDSLAEKIHILEKQYFPPVIEATILGLPQPIQSEIL